MQQALSKIIFPDRYFFEGQTCGIQGDPSRHLVMIALVGLTAPPDRPIRILEIGSWIGFSALTWSQAIAMFVPHRGTLLCVDPWTSYFSDADVRSGNRTYESMDFMGRSGLAYDLFCHNIKFSADGVQVDHIRGTSANVLPYLERKSFDIIYIDGSHYYSDALNDIKMAHELLRDGGVMCGDDLELQVGQCDPEFSQRHKSVDYVFDEASGQGYHPGVTLAVHEFLGPVSALKGCWYMKKTGDDYKPINVDGAPIFVPSHFPESYQKTFNAQLNKKS